MGLFADGWTEVVLACGEPSELLFVPIVVGMNADQCEREWAEGICFQLARHPNFNVRGNAILGLGHIAHTCRALNTEAALHSSRKHSLIRMSTFAVTQSKQRPICWRT